MKEGNITKNSFYSQILKMDWEYNVYLPPDYDSSKKYNLIYMLHGALDTSSGWISHGVAFQSLNNAINNNIIEPTIAIFPDGSPNTIDSWYINSRVFNMQDAFEKELFPHIEKAYLVKDNRNSRCIGGLSMGGYGALRFALRNANYFGSVFALSPAVFDYFSDDMKKMHTMPNLPENSMEKMFLNVYTDNNSNIDEKFWHDNNYKGLWHEYESSQSPLKIFVSNGTWDSLTLIEHTRILDNFLKEKNANYVYIEQKYLEHSWGAWATILPEVLKYIF